MNKVALITGGHHSLGKEISIIYAKNNYDLIITYHSNYKEAQITRDLIMDKYHVNVFIIEVDFNDMDSISSFLRFIKCKYKSIDVIVNNAAYTKEEEFKDKDVLEFKKILNVNTIAPYLIVKELSSLIPSNGSIINISSTNGIDTYSPLTLEYDASKAALISVTHNLAVEYPHIRVNAVAPGWIDTPSTKDLSPIYKENELKKIICKRFGKPEEIAKVVYFLSSEDASYINNQVIRVDGGFYVNR